MTDAETNGQETRGAQPDQALRCLLGLMGCALNGIVPSAELIADSRGKAVLELAQKHSVAALAASALMSAGDASPEWKAEYDSSTLRQALMGIDREAVLAGLDGMGIRHVVLKGTKIAELYPDPAMRQMADVDILFECPNVATRAAVKKLMVNLGFTVEQYEWDNEDIYMKAPVSTFEMHTMLFPGMDKSEGSYYADIWKRVVPAGSGHACSLTPTDLYIYTVAHIYKHYRIGGCGLRTLSDLYALDFLHGEVQDAIDRRAVAHELAAIGADDFESEMRSLSWQLLSDPYHVNTALDSLDSTLRRDLAYLVGSGTYGTIQNMVDNELEKMEAGNARSRVVRYTLRRLFPPVSRIVVELPFLDRHRWLIPFYYPYRLVHGAVLHHESIGGEIRSLGKALHRPADE